VSAPVELGAWRDAGVLRSVDVHLARRLGRIAGESRWEVLLAVAVVHRRLADGHVCVDLQALCAQADPSVAFTDDAPTDGPATNSDFTDNTPERTDDPLAWPDYSAWRELIAASPLVAQGDGPAPLVLDGPRLYLQRYHQHETRLADALRPRLIEAPIPAANPELARSGLDALFGPANLDWQHADLQRVAAATALQRRFMIISGGPGTGKTYTVLNLLLLLAEQRAAAGLPPLRMTLVAPTGKAAARLGESLDAGIERLLHDERANPATRERYAPLLPHVPRKATTIHRALEVIGGELHNLRRHAENPLATDLLLVDEASMVDLSLMRRLVDACPEHARIVLLGDKDQLASVEAGAVLGQLCRAALNGVPSSALREATRSLSGDGIRDVAVPAAAATATATNAAETPVTPGATSQGGISDSMVHFTVVHRFAPDSGIAALAAAVNAGDAEAALEVLGRGLPDVRLCALPEGKAKGDGVELGKDLKKQLLGDLGLGPYLDSLRAPKPDLKALHAQQDAFDNFRILCALRNSPRGVYALGDAVERALTADGRIHPDGDNYLGRPILISQNDYGVRLYNGDIGIIQRPPTQATDADAGDEDAGAEPRATFLEGGLRRFALTRLPAHETAYAMTVHKAQGSQVKHVALVLPTEPHRIVTRELLYTAITRASESVTIYGTAEALAAGIGATITRDGNLGGRMTQPHAQRAMESAQ
jgi:exodeoxyribonuclease V alpha subunit